MFWPTGRSKEDHPMDVDVHDEYMEIEAGRPSMAPAIPFCDVGEPMDVEDVRAGPGICGTGCVSSSIPGAERSAHYSKSKDNMKVQSQSDLLLDRKDERLALRIADGLKSPWSDPAVNQGQTADLEKTRKQLEKISTSCSKKPI